MRPYDKDREKGYCCEHCDGPYKKWKKPTRKSGKSSLRQKAKREIQKELKE